MILTNLFSGSFIPHGHCYLWNRELVWLHVGSDALTALAYYSIPAMLVYFVFKRQHLPFPCVFWMFCAFILSCGTTHIMEIWTLWYPIYWLSGAIKAITAGVSVATALLLVWVMPEALILPSPEELEQTNRQLQAEIAERQLAQEALVSSEKLFRAIFDQAFQFIGILETDGTILEVNQTSLEFTGLSREEVIGKPFWETPWWSCSLFKKQPAPVGFADRARRGLAKAAAGKLVRTEFEVPSVNGTFITIDASFKPVKDENGQVNLIVAEGRDITTHKRVEGELRQYKKHLELMVTERTAALTEANEQLQQEISDREQAELALGQSKARFQRLADNVPGMIYQFLLKTTGEMSFPFVSCGCRDIYDLAPEQIEENPGLILDIIHPDDRHCWESSIAHSAETLSRWQWEGRIFDPSGKLKWIAASSRPQIQSNGDIVWDGLVMDITERKQAEAALRESEERLQLALEGSEQGLWDWNIATGEVYLSPQWTAMLGYDVHEVEGHIRAWEQLVYPEDLPHVMEGLNEHIEGSKRIYETEYRMKTQSGEWKWILNRGKVCDRDSTGEALRMIGIHRDISDRKAYEEALVSAREAALQSLSIRSQFLANMSHEIRTPMNGVLGMAGLLLQSELSPKQRDFATMIHSSAQHLLSVINDILDFSKLEAGEMQLESLDFNLDTFMEEVVEILAAQAEIKGLELVILVYSQVPRLLRADPGRLRQILLNLVGNAIKFTQRGEVVVQVSWVNETETTHCLRFSVTDTGVGIPQESQQKLFQSFSQVDSSTTRQYGGTGLGLAICKQLVELMGGEIGVESEVGVGSTFWFTVELGKQVQALSPSVPLALAGRRLLVLAEHPKTRQVVQYMTHSWGMNSDAVGSSTIALRALRLAIEQHKPYDVVVLEVHLSESWEDRALVNAIRSDPQLAQTKLLLMTSLQQRDRLEALLGSGCCNYLLKPVRGSKLFEKLLMAIGEDSAVATEEAAGRVKSSVAVADNSVTIAYPEPNAIADSIGTSGMASRLDAAVQPPDSVTDAANAIKILVAEDHPVNQEVILNQLEALGYEAECVSNGAEVLDRLSESDYDIVLMDCQMPIKDGYEATGELREQEAGSERHTVVIALTAHAMPAERDKCLAAGMDDYLSKPVNLDALARVLERWTPSEPDEGRRTISQKIARSSGDRSNLCAVAVAEDTPLNLVRLQKLSRGKEALQQRLLQAFLDSARSDCTEISNAIAAADPVKIERQAHRLKGAAGNVGADALSAIAGQIEQVSRETRRESNLSLTRATQLLVTLENHLEQLQVFIQNHLRV